MKHLSRISCPRRIRLEVGGVNPGPIHKMLNQINKKLAVEAPRNDASPHINSHYYYL